MTRKQKLTSDLIRSLGECLVILWLIWCVAHHDKRIDVLEAQVHDLKIRVDEQRNVKASMTINKLECPVYLRKSTLDGLDGWDAVTH